MAEAADIGHGTTVTLASGAMAKVTSVSWSGIHRDAVETTNMGTSTAKTFIPDDVYDPGELSVDMQFETDQALLIDDAIGAVTVDYSGGGASHKWTASGFVTDWEVAAPRGEVMTASATLKFSGAITLS